MKTFAQRMKEPIEQRGMAVMIQALTVLTALLGVAAPVIAPAFADVYEQFDDIPTMTAMVLRFSPLLALVAAAYALAAVYFTWRHHSGRKVSVLPFVIILALASGQALLTIYALQLPVFQAAERAGR